MVQELYGAAHLISINIKWFAELPEAIRITAELIAGITALALTFRKVRHKVLVPLKWIYVRIPFMKRIAWLEKQMVAKNDVLDQILWGQTEIKNELTSNGGKSLKDTVLNIDRSVNKLRAGQKVIFDHTNFGILELDSNGHLLSANETVLEWSGKKIEEITETNYFNIFHQDDQLRAYQQVIAKVLSNSIFDIELRVTNSPDFKVRFIGKPNGKTTGYTCTLKKL